MRWSGIVKRYETFLAPSLVGRVELRATHYRGAHDDEGRGWITVDGRQVVSFESLPYLIRRYGLSDELQATGMDVHDADEAARAAARQEGLMHLWDYESAVADYPNHSMDEALASPNFIINALAMFDRRLGKRRLAMMGDDDLAHPLASTFLAIRLEAEGMGDGRATA